MSFCSWGRLPGAIDVKLASGLLLRQRKWSLSEVEGQVSQAYRGLFRFSHCVVLTVERFWNAYEILIAPYSIKIRGEANQQYYKYLHTHDLLLRGVHHKTLSVNRITCTPWQSHPKKHCTKNNVSKDLQTWDCFPNRKLSGHVTLHHHSANHLISCSRNSWREIILTK